MTTAAIYVRVSTVEQNLDLQLESLRSYCKSMGWKSIEYVECGSARSGAERPQLQTLLAAAKRHRFSVVLAWRLDRFARSLPNLIDSIRILDSAGVRFLIPGQHVDTDTKSPLGRFLVHILGAFAELERELILERVNAGIAEAKKRGVHCGRPLRDFPRGEAIQLRARGVSWRNISKALDVPLATVRRAVTIETKGGVFVTV